MRAQSGNGRPPSVKDHGPGIAANEIPLLFDRFQRASSPRVLDAAEPALGRPFAREAMRAMRGKLKPALRLTRAAEFTIAS